MSTNDTIRLCGGTFFDLLLQAKRQRTSARKKLSGDSDGLSDSNLLLALIHVANPEYPTPDKSAYDSFRTKTSNYKSCRTSTGAYLPFDDTEFVAMFEQRVQVHYTSTLSDMILLTNKFINSNRKAAWLVAALLELIINDISINDNDIFYLGDGRTLKKVELKMLNEINLQPFLLSIWHYIIMNRPDNSIGRDTFNSWHESPTSTKAKREFISSIGQSPKFNVRVNVLNSTPSLSLLNTSSPIFNAYAIMNSTNLSESEDIYSQYLENAYDKYSYIKTLLYNDRPRLFYDFYVCNDIYHVIRISKNTYNTRTIQNATAQTLAECSNFIIISGTGGLGKSMMMRHLLLDAIDTYSEHGHIPIFIPLKDYNKTYSTLVAYIYEKFSSLGAKQNINEFKILLSNGSCLLLFDGLDEISSSCRKDFEQKLELFADKYTKNMFVISSRPFGSFISFNRFTTLSLSPFSLVQALNLIDKLDFRSDEPSIKANFRKEVATHLYRTHHAFIENPLLLTIMLMTFEQFAEVPQKMHIFYREAYIALSQKHDASKGAYKRTLSTNLTADRFADYFAEFCARTYRDEKFELSELEFDHYYKLLNERNKDNNPSETSDFIYDLTANMCLMYYENQRYHFTHRSFQEYFCALYFSKQKDKNLRAIGDFFETKRGRNYGDITFAMLYSMIPEKIEEYIFTPFLNDLLEKCAIDNGYWTFLEILYPTIHYDAGEVDDHTQTRPSSFIYNFIACQEKIKGNIEEIDFPFYDEFVTDEYVYLDDEWLDADGEPPDGMVNRNDVESNYIDEYGEPDICGQNLEFEVAEIIDQSEAYEELLTFLDDDNFPLKKEYRAIRRYFKKLKQSQESHGNDLFDLF